MGSLLAFIIAGYIILLNYTTIIDKDVNEYLINREEIATTQIVNDIQIASLNNYEQIIKKIQPIDDLDELVLKDTSMYDVIDDHFHKYRKLQVNRKIGRQYFDITIFKSLIQTEILVTEVLKSMITVFLGLLVFLIVGNILISRNLWKPFKDTLSKLKDYELGSVKPVDFSKTSTREFGQLNSMINIMTNKIHTDYVNLKEFTENAAHEIQTPLAIIRSKCELLLQSGTLNETELKNAKSIYNSCLRLSKINRGLSLLAEIESGVYGVSKKVNVTEILEHQIEHYKEAIDLNNLQLEVLVENEIKHDINAELAEVLISNFIKNAIKHNISDGKISIRTSTNKIHFSNSGEPKGIDKVMFKRFEKSNTNSLGLGLSIISKICRKFDIKLVYNYQNGTHNFELIF
ncbi:hypothetical protein LCGC14_0199060 [marine sediment metagenome]|uniref:histidine kinase n=2 Tax=root TaxID=1 RepID=A0A0F9X3A7_9ZZZZ